MQPILAFCHWGRARNRFKAQTTPERMLQLAAAQLEEMKEINQKLARVIELLELEELAGHPT